MWRIHRLSSKPVLALLTVFSLYLAPGADANEGHQKDFAAFLAEVDATYPFFDLKHVREDWTVTKKRLSEQVKACESDAEFLKLVVEAMRCLRDSHLRLSNTRVPLPAFAKQFYPGISFMPATQSRVVVMWAGERYGSKLTPGTVVTRIDGQDARSWLEAKAKAAWSPENPWFASSPQRARLFAYRLPFTGASNETHVLSYQAGGKEQELQVVCDVEARGWPHVYAPPPGLTRAAPTLAYGRLHSGAGYMYLRSVREETAPAMQQALAAVSDVKGWIIDLRGNGGGGYDDQLIQRLKSLPRPVAVLIDAGCISAGETLARDLARYSEARLLGATSAGASSSKRQWTFPSGIATVTFSTRSRWRNDGEPIEFHGIQPDQEIEAVPEEVAQGINSEIRRAEEYLAGVIAAHPSLYERAKAFPAKSAASGPGVSGQVLDDEDNPIAGATITARSWGETDERHMVKATSGTDGAFTLGGLKPGLEYRIFAEAAEHAAAFINKSADPGATCHFRLPRTTAISGRVEDTSEMPVAAVSLELVPVSWPKRQEGHVLSLGSGQHHTGADGRFQLNAAPGRYWIKVYQPVPSADRCWQQIALNSPVLVEPGKPITDLPVRVVPPDAHTISGVVVDGQGRPLAGTVAAAFIPHDRHWWARSDAQGRFVLRAMNGMGRDPVTVHFDDYKTIIRDVAIGAKDVKLVKHERAGISGVFLEEDGQTPVKNFEVKVAWVHLLDCAAIATEAGAKATVAGETGAFRLEQVPAGRVVLEFKTGQRRYWHEVQVQPGHELKEQRIVRRAPCVFEGLARFTFSDGRTQNVGLEIEHVATGHGMGWVNSEISGAFCDRNLPAGEYDVRALYGGEVYQTKRVRLDYGKTTREEFAVGGTASIQGSLKFPTGVGHLANIHLREAGLKFPPSAWGGRPGIGDRVLNWTLANKADGSYQIRNVPAGTWEVVVYAGATDRCISFERLPHAAQTVTVTEGETKSLDLVLTEP